MKVRTKKSIINMDHVISVDINENKEDTDQNSLIFVCVTGSRHRHFFFSKTLEYILGLIVDAERTGQSVLDLRTYEIDQPEPDQPE